MIKRAECLCDGKILGIERIYTVINGVQINKKEELAWVREKGRKNELFCPCGCGANYIVVAGENNLREQHFRMKPGSASQRECTYVEEGPVSVNSKIILKCWLDDKIMPTDLETRVPICAVDDSKRKYEFTLLSRERGIAVNYCYNRSNLSSEKMEILDQNSKGIHIIHVIDARNSGTDIQYPEGAMKVQERQGYCLFLSISGLEYEKASMMAAYYGKDADGYWRGNIVAEGNLSEFWIDKTGDLIFGGQSLNELRDACKSRFEEMQEEIKRRREEARIEQEKERIRREEERIRKEREWAEEEKRRREELKRQEAEREAYFKRKAEERERARQWEKECAEHERMEREKAEKARKEREEEQKRKEAEADSAWIKFRETLSEQLNQQEKPVRDPSGARWIRCKYCGKESTDDDFSSYGGPGKINLGVCKECSKTESYSSNEESIPTPVIKIDPDLCPVCGGQLRKRSGQYGAFLGCSNYPKCRYTRKI